MSQKKVPSVITNFLEGYSREYDFYQAAAQMCAAVCERLLVEAGIRARITFRAKKADRLREKLVKRHQGKAYRTQKQIRDDLKDLAGVRIELYFPSDQEKVLKLFGGALNVLSTKSFPDGTDKPPSKVFSGYHATHLQVLLQPDRVEEPDRRFCNTAIEVQVASVLMHAWSEVEHDLVYKPLSGDVSEEEHAILDEINGLVLAGEIALQRLQTALEARVGQTTERFTNHYELASFLYEEMSTRLRKVPEDVEMGRLDVLLNLLWEADLATPQALRPLLDALETEQQLPTELDERSPLATTEINPLPDVRPLADQLEDIVLEDRPDLYQRLINIKRELRGRDPLAFGRKSADTKTTLIGEFVQQWVMFERFLGTLASLRGMDERSASHASPIVLLRRLELDPASSKRAERLRRMRNSIVHNPDPPSESALADAVAEMQHLFSHLQHSEDPQVSATAASSFHANTASPPASLPLR